MSPFLTPSLSLAPILDGRRPSLRASIFTTYMTSQRAVRDDRWKLIVYPQINKQQLFDLTSDPNELRDLAGNPAAAVEALRLTALLRDWQARLGDQQPLSRPDPLPQQFDFSKAKAATRDAAPKE